MTDSTNNTTMRRIYYALMGLFVVLLAFYLYQWSQGTGKLDDIGTPLTFIFVFSALLVGKSNVVLYYILTGAALLSLLGTIILLFID